MYISTAAGIMTCYAGSSIPDGWLLCNGIEVSRATYAGLYGVVGTTFGVGDGATTFNLPDLTDRMPIFTSGAFALGSTGGANTHALTAGEMPTHTHIQDAHTHAVTDPGHTHTSDGRANAINGLTVGAVSVYELDISATINSATTGITIDNATATNQNTGSDTAHNNLPPYVGFYFIIKT